MTSCAGCESRSVVARSRLAQEGELEYAKLLGECDATLEHWVDQVRTRLTLIHQSSRGAAYAYNASVPVNATVCGRGIDQLARLTARLCGDEAGFYVACDPPWPEPGETRMAPIYVAMRITDDDTRPCNCKLPPLPD